MSWQSIACADVQGNWRRNWHAANPQQLADGDGDQCVSILCADGMTCAFASTALHSCYTLQMMSYNMMLFMAAGIPSSMKAGSHEPVCCAGVLSVPMEGRRIICTILHHALHASNLPAFHPEMHQTHVQLHSSYLESVDAALTSTSREMGAGKWNGMHLIGRYLVTSFALYILLAQHCASAQGMPRKPGAETGTCRIG